MFEIASTIAAETCLILVGFCLKDNLQKASSTYESRLSIARALGVQFLDFRNMVFQFGQKVASAETELYEARSHPQSSIARFLGRLTGDSLGNAAKGNAAFSLGKSRTAQIYRQNFHNWFAETSADTSKLCLYQNSMFREKYLVLKKNERLFLNQPGIFLGFNINHRETSCIVRLRQRGGKTIDMSCFFKARFFKRKAKTFEKIFLPIPHGMELEQLTVKAAASTPWAFLSRVGGRSPDLRASISRKAPKLITPVKLCISGIVFWTGVVDSGWRRDLCFEDEVLTLSAELGKGITRDNPAAYAALPT